MNSLKSKSEEARRRAHEIFAKVKQRDTDMLEQRARLQEAESEKTARLRALRIAKEAADREAAERAAAAKLASLRKIKALDARRRVRPAPRQDASGSIDR